MVFIKVHRLTTGDVVTTGSKEDSWTSPGAYVLREIQVTPRGNSSLTNVQFYADIGGKPIFHPDIPADLLDPLNKLRLEGRWPLTKGEKLNYKLTNNSGGTENYDISLVLETEAWPPA